MHLIGRWPGMSAHLRDERHMPVCGVDAVNHEVSRARHAHEIVNPLNYETRVWPSGKRLQLRIEEAVTLAATKTHRTIVRTRQDQAHAGLCESF